MALDVRNLSDEQLEAIVRGDISADEALEPQSMAPETDEAALADPFTEADNPVTTLEELTGGLLTRGAFEAAGGTLGGLVGGGAGALAGGVPTLGPGAAPGGTLGVIAGGALGSAAGSALFDNVEDALRFMNVLETPIGQQMGMDRALEIAKTAGLAALEDVVATGVVDVAATGFRAFKPLVGKVLGVRGEQAREMTEQARRLGVRLGAADVGTGGGSKISRGFAETLGVFPFVAGPLRKSRQDVGEDIARSIGRRLDSLAPNATLANELGVEIIDQARNTRKEFKATAGALYKNLEDAIDALPVKDIIPTGPIMGHAVKQELARLEGTIVLEGGKELTGPLKKQVDDFTKALLGLPERITVPQFRNLSDNLAELFSTLRQNGADDKTMNQLGQLRTAMDAAFSGIDDIAPDLVGEEAAKRVVQARQTAANFYSQGILLFRRPTSKRAQRARKNLLGAGREEAGTINEDEVANVIINLKSPQAIKDLKALVGEETFVKAGRNVLENAVDLSTKTADDTLDFNQLRKLLGLIASKSGPSRAAVEEAIGKDTLKDVAQLATFAEVAVQSPEVSRFLKRRFTLGGLNSLKQGLTVGSAVGAAGLAQTSLKQALAVIVGTRAFGKLISDPEQLQLMQRAFLTPGVSQTFKRATAARLLENLVQPDLEREEQLLNLEQPQGA